VEIIGMKWTENTAEKYLIENKFILMFILSYEQNKIKHNEVIGKCKIYHKD
jgi:hypothetical protein